MKTKRRDFLALWAQAALAAQTAAPRTALSGSEKKTLREAALILIPADERSLGGGAPGVVEYVDLVVGSGPAPLLDEWRWGLQSLAQAKDLNGALLSAAKNEFRPRRREDHFFVLLKSSLVEAFYTSEEGIVKELGYKGMGHVMEFPDFTGVTTRTPAGYRPMLKART